MEARESFRKIKFPVVKNLLSIAERVAQRPLWIQLLLQEGIGQWETVSNDAFASSVYLYHTGSNAKHQWKT